MKSNSQYDSAYSKLNNEQKQAVDTVNGPVIVIAGPGTGKTQILTTRIGKIVNENNSPPHEILCLSFSSAAAQTMKKRLFNLIGSSAYNIKVSTFHSFCSDVIKDNPSNFDDCEDYEPVSQLEQYEIVIKIINDLDYSNTLRSKWGISNYAINGFLSLVDFMKKENYNVESLLLAINNYLIKRKTDDEFYYKRNYKNFFAGDFNENRWKEELNKFKKCRDAIPLFDDYNQKLVELSRYDYNDMIDWVIRAFNSNDLLLEKYQNKYNYFLVDEFQDTNSTQYKLVELLSESTKNPNLFVVGDQDQMIYRFQGADSTNFDKFKKNYEHSCFQLLDNYRSTQNILDTSFNLISEKNTGKSLDAQLIAKNNYDENTPLISIVEYPNPIQEAISVFLEIKDLIQNGVNPMEIAVIYRNHKLMDTFAHLFELHKIPFVTSKKENILEAPLINFLFQLLQYLATEHKNQFSGEHLLFKLLHFQALDLSTIDLAKISLYHHENKIIGSSSTLREILSNRQCLLDLGCSGAEKILTTVIIIEKLLADSFIMTELNLINQVVKNLGLVDWIVSQNNKVQIFDQLNSFKLFVEQEMKRKNKSPNNKLGDLVRVIQMMIEQNIIIEKVDNISYTNNVSLLSAHGSKGLEFQHVYIIGCNSKEWEEKRSPGSGFIPNFITKDNTLHSDERRLFYVAMTRAKHHLTISYNTNKEDGKGLDPSTFVSSILDYELCVKSNKSITEYDYAYYSEMLLKYEPCPDFFEHHLIDQFLDSFVLSFSSFNKYRKCPITFYYENVLHAPQEKNKYMIIGEIVHETLELFSKLYFETRGKLFDNKPKDWEKELNQIYDTCFKKRQHLLDSDLREQLLENNWEALKSYYTKVINKTWNNISRMPTEVMLQLNLSDEIKIEGIIDKIEIYNDKIRVVDYKTADPKNNPKLYKSNWAKNSEGGEYFQQMSFYKILLTSHLKDKMGAVSFNIEFVNDTEENNLVNELSHNDQDIDWMKSQIVEVNTAIQNKQFSKGCGEKACNWCSILSQTTK